MGKAKFIDVAQETVAEVIWAILVDTCMERDSLVGDFVLWFLSSGNEYRFQGKLGGGGKFRRNNNGWYVTCYQEYQLPVDAANNRLDALREAMGLD